MSEKIYMVRRADNDNEFEDLFLTFEEAESFAKRCVLIFNEPQIIEEYSLANRMKIEL